jgi:phosphomannomutase
VPCSQREHGDTLILFDVDGTLAVAGQKASQEMLDLLTSLRERYAVGIVGAAEFEKQQKQLGAHGLHNQFDFVFSENGVHAFRAGKQIHLKSTEGALGEENFAFFESQLEKVLADHHEEAEALLKQAAAAVGTELTMEGRGLFLQKRQCTMNITPIGRTPTMTKEERGAYDKLDRAASFRKRIVGRLSEACGPGTACNLQFAISGQVGFDLAPVGWDKTFCLQWVPEGEFPGGVHFFGDQVHPGGGDHELFEHPRTLGHEVSDADDTMRQIRSLFSLGPPPPASAKGKIFLSLGPSGAGKDTLLMGAAEELRADGGVQFVRRVITREPAKCTALEIPVSTKEFERMKAAGELACFWGAHATQYGIPQTALAALAAGQRQVWNVSRTKIAEIEANFAAVADVGILNITASVATLVARLTSRARESAADIEARIKRSAALDPKVCRGGAGSVG